MNDKTLPSSNEKQNTNNMLGSIQNEKFDVLHPSEWRSKNESGSKASRDSNNSGRVTGEKFLAGKGKFAAIPEEQTHDSPQIDQEPTFGAYGKYISKNLDECDEGLVKARMSTVSEFQEIQSQITQAGRLPPISNC